MSNNWEAQPDEEGMLKRKCSDCGKYTFEIFKGPRPKKGTIGYRVRCSGCGHELTLSPRPEDRPRQKKSK
jgi:DNA-directed RNA polymerase subunit RPC12/RpoP